MQENNNAMFTFADLALALASDYQTIYVIDTDNDSYVEYSPSGSDKELVHISNGDDFYSDVPINARLLVYKDDQEYFMNTLRKENVTAALNEGKSFTLTYRLVIEGKPQYFFLKTIRANEQYIIIGVRNIDAQKRRELADKAARAAYTDIAMSLASVFEIIYHVDTETGRYKVYASSPSFIKLGLGSEGDDFFGKAKGDMKLILHPDDFARISRELEKDVLLERIKSAPYVTFRYRQILDSRTQYVELIAFRQRSDTKHIVLAVRNIDQQVRQEQENETFSQLTRALASRYEVIYRVNTVTNEYTEYSSSEKYQKLKVGTKGADFFAESQQNMKRDIYPDDLPRMAHAMQKENLLSSVEADGKTILNYRLILDGEPQYVALYAVRPIDDPTHIIIGVANVNETKRIELAYQDAMDMANKDALTGVKNKRAYVQTEMELDRLIESGELSDLSVVVCDVNGLKHVNDAHGHKAGDDYIKCACSIICDTFKHSPVFRIGGDEFTVILRGSDNEHRLDLIDELADRVEHERHDGVPILAYGISVYEDGLDMRVQDVFERADNLMYENKEICKSKAYRYSNDH